MAYPFLQRSIIPAALRRIRIEHQDRIPANGPFVLVANHISYLETVLIAFLVVRRTNQRPFSLTKESVWNFFHLLRLDNWLGMILVPREHREGVVDHAVAKLRAGHPVIIFPEGTRSFAGRLAKGKTGAARIACAANVPIIPVGYHGRVAKTARDSIATFLFHADEIVLRVGNPMTFRAATPTRDGLERMTRDIMLTIAALSGFPYPYA